MGYWARDQVRQVLLSQWRYHVFPCAADCLLELKGPQGWANLSGSPTSPAPSILFTWQFPVSSLPSGPSSLASFGRSQSILLHMPPPRRIGGNRGDAGPSLAQYPVVWAEGLSAAYDGLEARNDGVLDSIPDKGTQACAHLASAIRHCNHQRQPMQQRNRSARLLAVTCHNIH